MASHPADTRIPHLDSPPRRVKKPSIVPVGLNFGPTSLSIAFFSDDSEYYTGVPCNELYTGYFQDSLSEAVQCSLEPNFNVCTSLSADPLFTSDLKDSGLVEAFSKHIKSAMGMAIWSLDNNPAVQFKLMAVTVPDHWGESARALALVANATKLAGHPLDGSHMIIPLSRAIQSAFEMTRYTEGKYLTLVLDYNKSYLHVMLVEMYGTSCIMKRQLYFPHLGEDELHKVTVSGNAVTTPNFAKGEPSDGLRFYEASNSSQSTTVSSASDLMFPIGDFHTNHFSQANAPFAEQPSFEGYPATNCTSALPIINHDRAANPDSHTTHRPIRPNKSAPIIASITNFLLAPETLPAAFMPNTSLLHNVKYIVIDGEASIPSLLDLRDAVKAQFIQEKWITVEGGRRDCGAYGAVLAARRQMQNPKHFGEWRDLPGYIGPGRAR